jgi:Ser/Thr protein kinase RdoA (MazF antagonist)
VNAVVERCVGPPAVYEELKHKPGRRLTLRVRGTYRTAIVKLYRADSVPHVVEKISALAGGPPEPELPRVLASDRTARLVVLSHVPGTPLREAVLASDEAGCRRAGAAIARWHVVWAGVRPQGFPEHTIEDELANLVERAARAPHDIAAWVAETVHELREPWEAATVVHGNLDEGQVLLGERVGLIDLEDAALGPPELDVGSLLARLDLLELTTERDLTTPRNAFLDGYRAIAALDADLLARCCTLARHRLACSHVERRLAAPVETSVLV